MDVTALIAMIDDLYPSATTTAVKIGYMNSVLNWLSARRYGLFVEDVSTLTVEDQEGYDFPTGLLDVSDIDYLAVANSWPYQSRKAQVTTGAATQSGTITVVVTAANMDGSPVSVALEVVLADSAATVAGKIRVALAADSSIAAFFEVGGTGAYVTLTAIDPAENDSTMDIAVTDTDGTGVVVAADTDNTTALTRDEYTSYVVGFQDDSTRSGKNYFQIVDSSGNKTIGLYPTPTESGLQVRIRYYKSITALSASSMSAQPEIDSRFHEMLAYYAVHQIAAKGASPDKDQSNYYLSKYLSVRGEYVRLRQQQEIEHPSDRRDLSHWNRRIF